MYVANPQVWLYLNKVCMYVCMYVTNYTDYYMESTTTIMYAHDKQQDAAQVH